MTSCFCHASHHVFYYVIFGLASPLLSFGGHDTVQTDDSSASQRHGNASSATYKALLTRPAVPLDATDPQPNKTVRLSWPSWRYIEGYKLDVIRVEDLTQFPEMLDGRHLSAEGLNECRSVIGSPKRTRHWLSMVTTRLC